METSLYSYFSGIVIIAKLQEMDSAGRIALLTDSKIGAIQKRYAELKAEVAYLDRKRRRAKQREREGKNIIVILCSVNIVKLL